MYPDDLDVMSAETLAECEAVAGCDGQACFQVWVEASVDRRPVRHRANACAAHIGELVEGAKAWAHDDNLTDGTLTVLVIDPAAESRRASGGEPGPLWPGFAFAAFAIPQPAQRLR